MTLLLAVGTYPAAAGDGAAFSFELHYDPATRTSVAIVRSGSTGAELARVPWEGRLPLGADVASGAPLVPARLIAQLRDILDGMPSAEAQEAAARMRIFLGEDCNTPACDIGDFSFAAVLGGTIEVWWCGERILPDFTCPLNCDPLDSPKVCSGCGCSGYKGIFDYRR
ncbi:hypothetical protein D6833_02675 [Candidatus Parcubacteria bacterium]|nr:MAG: hypothetical protein D6833_02675 [Candidatus Parcubacteria bacterium]